jgi:hypothetical protein
MTRARPNLYRAAKECSSQFLKELRKYEHPTNYLEIIIATDATVLSAALLIKDHYGITPLDRIISHSSLANLIALLDKINADALFPAILVQDNHGCTPLHSAAKSNDSEYIIALIGKLSTQALLHALLIRNMNGETPLDWAATNSNPAGLIAILDKIGAQPLSIELGNDVVDEVTLLASALSQSPALIEIIKKVNDDTIQLIFRLLRQDNSIADNVLQALLPRLDTVTGLSLLDEAHWGRSIRCLLIDSAFDENLADIHQKFFTNKMASTLSDRIWWKIKRGEMLMPDVRLRMQLITVLMAKPAFSLTRDQMSFFLFLKKTTVAKVKWIDTLIQQHLANRPLVSMFFSRDENMDAAYIKMLMTEPAEIPDHLFDESHELSLKISQNKILLKIIAPELHARYMAQLQDYNFRPTLRETIIAPKYKLVHLTGEVVVYDNQRQKNKPPYTHTKKSSATLLGKNLKTPVFGHHHASRPLVGFLFNKEDCIIKAMLKQDKGTYHHQWLTHTENEAKNAAHLIPNYNFTDESAFLNEINTDSSRTNEVLVKVKKEAIVAIVIARKDSNSISIAKERQNEVRDKLGLDLPVVFYDSNNGVLELVQEKLGNLAQKLKIN